MRQREAARARVRSRPSYGSRRARCGSGASGGARAGRKPCVPRGGVAGEPVGAAVRAPGGEAAARPAGARVRRRPAVDAEADQGIDRATVPGSSSTGRSPAAVAHACSLGEVWLCSEALTGVGAVYAKRADDGTDLHPGLNVAAFAEETVVAAACVLPAPPGSGSPTRRCSAARCSPDTAPSTTPRGPRRRVRRGVRRGRRGAGHAAGRPDRQRRRSSFAGRAQPTMSWPPTPPPARSAGSPAGRAWTSPWSVWAAP
jgi:hypothetical protein